MKAEEIYRAPFPELEMALQPKHLKPDKTVYPYKPALLEPSHSTSRHLPRFIPLPHLPLGRARSSVHHRHQGSFPATPVRHPLSLIP